MRSEVERLQDILDAFALIREHGTDDLERYERDVVLRWFLLKQVEIIGEAVFRLSAETLAAHPSVPWAKIRRTRHILVHDYHDVNWGSSGTFSKSISLHCAQRWCGCWKSALAEGAARNHLPAAPDHYFFFLFSEQRQTHSCAPQSGQMVSS